MTNPNFWFVTVVAHKVGGAEMHTIFGSYLVQSGSTVFPWRELMEELDYGTYTSGWEHHVVSHMPTTSAAAHGHDWRKRLVVIPSK